MLAIRQCTCNSHCHGNLWCEMLSMFSPQIVDIHCPLTDNHQFLTVIAYQANSCCSDADVSLQHLEHRQTHKIRKGQSEMHK